MRAGEEEIKMKIGGERLCQDAGGRLARRACGVPNRYAYGVWRADFAQQAGHWVQFGKKVGCGNPLDAQAGIESLATEDRAAALLAAIHSMLKRALNRSSASPRDPRWRGNPLDAQAGIESRGRNVFRLHLDAAIHSMLKRALNQSVGMETGLELHAAIHSMLKRALNPGKDLNR